jgi:hypothetical protein
VSAKEGQIAVTFNSLVFHTIPTVEFGFGGISDVSVAMPITVWDVMTGLR